MENRVKNNFIEFLVSLQKFLNSNGFEITSADIEEFLECINLFNVSIYEKDLLANISMPIFAKTKEQSIVYKVLFKNFYDRKITPNITDERKDSINRLKSKTKELSEKKNQLNVLKNNGQLAESGKNSSKKIKYKASKEFLSCVEDNNAKELFKKLEETGLNKKESRELEKALKDILTASIKSKHFLGVSNEIKNIKKMLTEIIEAKAPLTKETVNKNLEKITEQEIEVQRKLEEEYILLQNSGTIIKDTFIEHRSNWIGGHMATQSNSIGDTDLSKEFRTLSTQELEKIKNFIKNEAIRFRTRATRDIKTRMSNNIDFKTTMKKATETGGIPLRIAYEKPKLNKAKIVMFLDISGSCKSASELMLYFMYTVKEVFQGGVKCYVFVNKLYDISKFLELNNPEEAIQAIFKTVPTKGVYSNYYAPFKTFAEENISEITKDTLIYFIGDARNNRNPSGEDNIKTIARKARKSFWLNTEPADKWGQGDSVINKYIPYMNSVFKVLNTSNLIESINKSLN